MASSYYRSSYKVSNSERICYYNDRAASTVESAQRRLRNRYSEPIEIIATVHVQDAEVQKNIEDRKGPLGAEGTPGA